MFYIAATAAAAVVTYLDVRNGSLKWTKQNSKFIYRYIGMIIYDTLSRV